MGSSLGMYAVQVLRLHVLLSAVAVGNRWADLLSAISFGAQKLFDYRIAQPYSLCPAITAIFTPRSVTGNHTTLEVARGALAMPGLLDHLVVT